MKKVLILVLVLAIVLVVLAASQTMATTQLRLGVASTLDGNSGLALGADYWQGKSVVNYASLDFARINRTNALAATAGHRWQLDEKWSGGVGAGAIWIESDDTHLVGKVFVNRQVAENVGLELDYSLWGRGGRKDLLAMTASIKF